MNVTADHDARMWATFAHLSALTLYLGVPFGNIIGPLVIWLIKKDTTPFVDDQGREALNFQISVLIYSLVAGILCLLLIGFVLLALLAVFQIACVIIAAIKANQGESFRYPLTIRFL